MSRKLARSPAAWLAIATALAWLAHATTAIVRVGPVAVPGFAAAADLGLLVVLGGVVWFMVTGPVRRATRIRAGVYQ